MNKYTDLKNRQQEEFNAFPLGAAFGNKQFAEMMQAWGLTENDTDKIYSIGGGCYIRKSDHKAFHEMLDRHEKERRNAIAADLTGYGFLLSLIHISEPTRQAETSFAVFRLTNNNNLNSLLYSSLRHAV